MLSIRHLGGDWLGRMKRAIRSVMEALQVGQDVLVHCVRGLHRSAAFVSIILALLGDWSDDVRASGSELEAGMSAVFLLRGHSEADARRSSGVLEHCLVAEQWAHFRSLRNHGSKLTLPGPRSSAASGSGLPSAGRLVQGLQVAHLVNNRGRRTINPRQIIQK